jgi:2,3-bisphosphoglycerate-independent phosphoglycerate mutase
MGVLFYPGMSYRNLMVWEGGIDSVETVPPHEIMGKEVGAYLPAGEGSRILKKIMAISEDVMKQHPVNSERIRSGKLAATSVWLWGQGKAPILPSFESAFGLKGSVIAAVDLVRGIGRYLGLRLIDVTGATGYVDTNFEGKGKACIDQLEENDMVLVHVEAPDEAGHNGDFLTKIDSIEKIDLHILGPLLEKIKGGDDIRVLFLPDHPTPVEIRTHSNEPVPFLIYPTPDVNDSSYINPSGYSEDEADKTGYVVAKGTELMGLLTKE